MPSHEASLTLAHTLHHVLYAVRELVLRHDENDLVVLHRCKYEAHELLVHHCDVRVEREPELHRCTCAVRGSALQLYMYVGRELALRHDGNDLVVHHHDVRVERGLVHHRCTYVARELGDHLRSDHGFRPAFRHPYVVASRKDSKHHYYALRYGLQRVEIRRDYAHLDREVHEVREIRPLPPWNLA
jgi:hypothetical protein